MTKTKNLFSSTTFIVAGALTVAVVGVIVMVATRGDDEPADARGPAALNDDRAAAHDDADLDRKLDDIQKRLDRLDLAGGGNPGDAIAARGQPAVAEDQLVFAIPIDGDPVKGAPDALVTVVRASEYMCPFCERSRESFERVLTDYPRDVRIVHKDMAHIHAEGPRLAYAACAAHRQGKFWEMDDLLWQAFGRKDVAPDRIDALAEDLGLAMGAYRDDMADSCVADVDSDERIFKNLGITGVPAYFINGRLIRGAQPYTRFKQLVDEELALARKRVASGASRATYYADHVVAKGLTTYTKPAPARPPSAPGAPAPSVRADPDPAAVFGVNLDGDPFRGNPDALVTIVRGGEYACPYCDRVRPTLDQLVRAYPDDVRIVYMDFVVHPDTATEPAKAACAANRQGKFWAMDELIWEKGFRTRQFTAEHMEDLAREARLDLRRYRADLASCADEVRADIEKLTRFGVRGTPAFFINGRYLSGAQPYARFEALVEEELAKARARVAQGTSPSDYYGTWVVGRGLTSFTPAPPLAEAPPP